MAERSYTVKEIDELREACESRWLFGTSAVLVNGGTSRPYREEEKASAVEQLVRTHMLAGHTAQDILDEDKKPTDAPCLCGRDENWPTLPRRDIICPKHDRAVVIKVERL